MINTAYLLSAFFFGACIGSFLNVVIWRLPQGLSLNGRSFCPNCKHGLVWYDLIPLLSIIWRKFKCGYCAKPISSRYFSIEAITGFLFALAYYLVGTENALAISQLLFYWFVISIIVVVFVIDLEHYLILDKIILPASALLLLYHFVTDVLLGNLQLSLGSNLISGLLASLVASGFFYVIWLISKGKWIGFGDVKYAIFMGLAVGFPNVLVALFSAFMIGSIVGVFLIIFGGKELSSKLPFGTFLSIGLLLALFWGQALVDTYLSLIGLK